MIMRILKLVQKYGGGCGSGARMVTTPPSARFARMLDALRHQASIVAVAPFWSTPPIPELCLSGASGYVGLGHREEASDSDLDAPVASPLWFAVPKKQVTRHKKRLKTTVQKRIPLRTDIVVDPRTGQVTRKHRLPFNWKDYLLDPSSSPPPSSAS